MIYTINIYLPCNAEAFREDGKNCSENGRSQAVRLPKDFGLTTARCLSEKRQRRSVDTPERFVGIAVGSLKRFSPDFMSKRVQPDLDERKDF